MPAVPAWLSGRTRRLGFGLLLIGVLAESVQAQAPIEHLPATVQPSGAQPAPKAGAGAPPTVVVATPSASACLVGDALGVPAADAHTATALVCDALRSKGANVSTQPVSEAQAAAAGHASAYRVELRPLGRLVILQVGYEAPLGARAQTRSVQLQGVEEVTVAAPRLAEALLRGTSVDDSARVGNLVGQETRVYAKEYGEMLAGIGLLGFALPDDTWGGYGIYGRLHYEARRYAIGLDLRIAGSDQSKHDATMTGISLGARYFLSEQDVTPFVGGGAGILWLTLEDHVNAITSIERRGSGLAAFGEFGVEFLRLHETRFDVLLRADVPCFDLEAGDSKYRLPVALLASFSF